ncbi:hypothetical protein JG687_00011029 [Phytophthora cactorum]|uniref:Uncharacterized protein n=1 Tax=Phytophthora cactorum TaxID=29920 RepID=A0A8T1U7I5_9STRA|nr:hypothetical protein JG687_00011029 [Phytophthora cactorum]
MSADYKLVVNTPDPVTESQRPLEEDPNASSLKSSRSEEGAKAPTTGDTFFSAVCPYRTPSVDAKFTQACFQVRCDITTKPDPAVCVRRHQR